MLEYRLFLMIDKVLHLLNIYTDCSSKLEVKINLVSEVLMWVCQVMGGKNKIIIIPAHLTISASF